jgi:hypothetical protein
MGAGSFREVSERGGAYWDAGWEWIASERQSRRMP